MVLSAPSTPKMNFATPRRLGVGLRTPATGTQETPECFNKVTMETPVSTPKLKKRRSSKEKFDQVNNLTVAVRIRPMNNRELSCVGAANVVKVNKNDLIVHSGVVGSGSMNVDHIFQYDHIFWSVDEESPLYSDQKDVFSVLGKPLLDSAFKGYNACLFAYGQTGSGKSYSMMGPYIQDVAEIDSADQSGVIPRFCRELFLRISELDPDTTISIDVNYFEIYNEKIHDLLAASNNRTPLKVREHPEWGPYVVDLSVHSIKTYDELRECLLLGNKNRATAATAMNEKSSRSHSIFSIELCLSGGIDDPESSRRSKVSLVDLAGSERIGHSLNSEEKIRQGVSINKSLLTLGKVISALAEHKRNQFVPYRESVLTWLLRESLGGNSLTSMLATISPANSHVDETLATLRYACQARAIVNRARVNESPHNRLIRELTAEVERLRALRKDYERNSLSSSIIQVDESMNDSQEMEKLREKLSETEKKLLEAQLQWEQRFMETKQHQLEELAAAEKRKEELESHVRVFQTLDMNINLSPVRTNFLETVDDMLKECGSDENINWNCNLERIKDLCSEFGMDCQITINGDATATVLNKCTHKQAICSVNRLDSLRSYPDVRKFFDKLQWLSPTKSNQRLSKAEVTSSINQIYQALAVLRPTIDEEDKLRLLFAKVNKSVQSLETALLNSVNKSSQKNVTFNV